MFGLPGLDSVGVLYLWLLVGLLIVALGLPASKLLPQRAKSIERGNDVKMFNNWFKLALVSFFGIIISSFALGLLSTTAPNNMHSQQGGNMGMMGMPMNGMQQQGSGMGMMNMPMGGMPMGGMPQGGGMGMMNMPMGSMPQGGGMGMMNMPMGGASGGGMSSGGMGMM